MIYTESNLPVHTKASWPNFLQYFIRKQSFGTLRILAQEGRLDRLGIRLNSWRVFLGLFAEVGNEHTWSDSLRVSRERYNALKKSFEITDPLLGNNKLTRIRADVVRDMNRTFQNHSFFTQVKVKEEIVSVLSIWATTNELGYLQGMSEIASVIYLQVFSEIYNEKDNALKWFNSEEWVEADTFEIFNRLFEVGLQNMYIREVKARPKHAFMGLFQEFNLGYSQEDINSNPVIKVCHDVYEVYLPLIDRGLFEYLRENNIESHLFLL